MKEPIAKTDEDEVENTKYSKLNPDTEGKKVRKLTVVDLFKSPNLAKNTLILILVWWVRVLLF